MEKINNILENLSILELESIIQLCDEGIKKIDNGDDNG